MAHTFDIRFARSVGLAGLFEAPANRLGWKGAGSLSIDSQGISVAMKRGLLTLFARRARRFSASNLREVYREGEALRLEFNTADSREVVPVWASGRDAAAEIVKLLPTSQTVELDHTTATNTPYRLDWPLFTVLVACASVIGTLLIVAQRPPAAVLPAPSAVATYGPDVETRAPVIPSPVSDALGVPIAKTAPVYPAARRYVELFEMEVGALRDEYVALMEAPSPIGLEALGMKWHAKTLEVGNRLGHRTPDLVVLRDVQVAICVSWRDFLTGYAEGLRLQNLDRVNTAFAARDQADVLRERMKRYVPE